MAGYLRKYVGTYEVRADYDEDTNDFPRLLDGSLDPSFDDYYIKCANGIKIRHATGSTLSCYIPSVQRGKNIIKQLNDIGSIVIEFEILDSEVYFTFPASDIDIVAQLCKVKTRGKNIQPLSPKTLPKRKSIVPESEMQRYKKLCSQFGEKPIDKAQVISKVNREFEQRLKGNYKYEMKSLKLDFRSYIWHIGKWDEYLAVLDSYNSSKA